MRGTDCLDTGGTGLQVGLSSRPFSSERFEVMRKRLPVFLGLPNAHFDFVSPENSHLFDLFIGWGLWTPSHNIVVKYSISHQKPILFIEDGFLSSMEVSFSPNKCLSISIDDMGIYYDAQIPSRMEKLILESTEKIHFLQSKART